MLIEPILGEGGYVVPPPGFLEGVRHLCDEHGILLIVDEIQSGMGRTGRWWGYENFGIVPDILTLAKGIASGLPLSGVIARRAADGPLESRGRTAAPSAATSWPALPAWRRSPSSRKSILLENARRPRCCS